MGTAPICLNDIIAEMLALQKSLPPRPSFPELDIAIATIAKVDDELAAKQNELRRQSKPEDVPAVVFVALQEMRTEAMENSAKEQKREAEEVVQLEERHRRYDEWIRKVHACLSSSMLSGSGEDADADGRTVYPVSTEVDSKEGEIRHAQGSARSVLDATWDSPTLESSEDSSVGVSVVVDESEGVKLSHTRSATYGQSDSFSMVAQPISWKREQPKADIFLGDERSRNPSFPILAVDGDVGSNGADLSIFKKTGSVLSMLESASKEKQTCLNLRGAFSKEIEWVPESIGKMTWLTDLNLSGNRLTILPDSIGDLANLVSLDVSTNQLVALPETIGQLACLKRLVLDNNKIEELPYTIGQCTCLVELRASFNQLKALPEATGKLTQLQWLDVHWNKLGSLPSTIASMRSLVDLDASFNEIHHIPDGLCQVTMLTRLNLASNFNELQELPRDIGNLQKLKVLNLSCNQLKVLPDSFALLTNLQKLDLGGNPLRVPPIEIADQGKEAVLKYMADVVAAKERGKAAVRKTSIWARLFFTCGKPSVIETGIAA